MGHHHHHHHNHSHNSQENIKTAFLLNLAFTIFEVIGGIWTNSMAVLSDALHDLGDSLSLGIAWYLEKRSGKGPDMKYSFGYARFSLLGALISSMVLIAGSIMIFVNSIPRIIRPESINVKGMLVFAVLGIVVNGAAVLRLKRATSINEKMVAWHLMEDVLGWAVLLVAGIVLMFADIPVLDPALSIVITLYVLYNVVKNLKEIINVFLQGVPKNFSIPEIEKAITENTGVLSVHHTHLWSLEGKSNFLSTHIVVADDLNFCDIIKIKQKVRELAKEKGIRHVTIEVDYESEDCKDFSC